MHRLFLRTALRALVAVGLVASTATLAASENYGSINGYVVDVKAGNPLAGVNLTVTGPALLQPQTTLSKEDGRYEFARLPPGENYVIEASGAGLTTPMTIKDIVVRVGRSTPVDVLAGEFSETVVVTGANPLMTADTAQTGAVVTSEKAVATPIFNQVQGITQLAPGVGPGNRPSTRGGLGRYTRFFVDGMDTTDVTDGSLTSLVNFNAVENFEIITGGYDAQYNSMGAIENLVTKSGGNDFKYDVQGIASPDWLNVRSRAPSNNPGVYGNFTEPATGVKDATTTFYAPNVNVGGPIIKDKLWFYASGQANFSGRENYLTFRDGSQENRPTDTFTGIGRLKLTWQATTRDRLSVGFNYDQNTISNNRGSASVAPDAETHIDRKGWFAVANYDHSFSDALTFQLQTGFTVKYANFTPEVRSDNPAHIDLSNGSFVTGNATNQLGSAGNVSLEAKQRYQFDPSITWSLGDHKIKGGLQLSLLTGKLTTETEGRYRYFDRGGICDPNDPATFAFCNERVSFFNGVGAEAPHVTRASTFLWGGFIQDRWTVNHNLTINPGIRFDVGRMMGDGGQFLRNLVGFGPRLSAVYDVTGDRKTLISAGYGRSNDVGDVGIAQRGNPAIYSVSSFWSTTTNSFPDCLPDPNLTQPGCRISGGAAGRTFGTGPTPPHTDEVTLGLKQEIAQMTTFGVDLTYRRYSNLFVEEETNRQWDLTGTRIVGYNDGQAHTIFKVHNPDSAYRDYKAVDLWVQGQPGNWDLLASYELGFVNGTVDDYFDGYLNNPRMVRFYEGPSSDDMRHYLKGSVGYKTPFGLDFGFRFQYRTGTPVWMRMPNPADSSRDMYRTPRGTGYAYTGSTANFNDPEQITELRNPDQMNIDAQARYDIGSAFKLRQKIELTFLVINLLNSTAPTAYNDRYTTTNNTFGTVASNGRLRPLQAEILLRIRN